MKPEADACAYPPCLSTIPVHNTYLKVTALTVVPSGQFLCHQPTSSDMDGHRILTCNMGDLPVIAVGN